MDHKVNGTHRRVHAPTRITVIPVATHPTPPNEQRLADLAEAGLRLERMRRTLEIRRRRESAAVWLALLVLFIPGWLLAGGAVYALLRWPWATLAAAAVVYGLVALHLRLRE